MNASTASTNTNQGDRRRRRGFRFGVRILLFVVTIVAVILAWTMKCLHARKAAVANIHRVHGSMGVAIAGPEWLRTLIADDECFFEPQRVSLGPIANGNHPLDDEILASVAESLLAFDDLRVLEVRRSTITDKSAPLLAKLDSVTHLRLSYTHISDESVPHLAQLPTILSLLLANTRLTDACVDELSAMTTLTELDIRGTQISQDGVSRLKNSLPACKISY